MSRSRPLWRALGRAVPADWLRDPLRLAVFAGHATQDAIDDDARALRTYADLCLALWSAKEAGRRLTTWATAHGSVDPSAREQDPVAAWAANDQYWFMAELEEGPASGG